MIGKRSLHLIFLLAPPLVTVGVAAFPPPLRPSAVLRSTLLAEILAPSDGSRHL